MIWSTGKQIAGRQEREAAYEAIERDAWVEGVKAREFENSLKEFLGVRYVELTNSGSSANLAAIMCLKSEFIPEEKRLREGDEIITTALSFPTTVSPIVMAGCVPVFVDVELGTWNVNPRQVREMITDKTKAIILAHNLGNPFNVDEILDICKEFGLTLIEDNCDSLGSTWKGKKTGSIGHIGTSSFYPAHHISTGEGGAVYTNDPKIKRALSSVINWGRHCWCEPNCDNTCGKRFGFELGELPEGYDHKNIYAELGFNLKMTDIQAAIGVEQMKRLEGFISARKSNHEFLRNQFALAPNWFERPEWYEGASPSWFGYVVKVKPEAPFTARELQRKFQDHGIMSRAFFCGNITKQPVFTSGRYKYRTHRDLSVSDDVMSNAFWIGVHPGITEEQKDDMSRFLYHVIYEWKAQPSSGMVMGY
jgi:CDP-6-deoxy-D-xylo-4-hexulose-3-dehydrase